MNSPTSSPKLLVIGWDAADWQFINPLLDAGRMPYLQQLVERGVMGNLASQRPMLSPILWTSIVTGKRGCDHGVLSFLEPTPDGTDIRPATSTSRTTRALWNMLSQRGLKTHAVAWYASHPAEPINGVCVSDQFLHCDESKLPDWPMPEGAVHPLDLRDAIAQLRISPSELGASDLLPFIPQLAEIDLKTDPRPAQLAKALARAASVQAVATAILDAEPWDALFVYFDMIDVAGHTFMPMHPPAMPNVQPRDAALYAHVMSGVYQFHDMLLGRLMQMAGEDATIVLCSDHGFYCDHRRPLFAGESEAEQAAHWHNPLGMLAMAGPGIKSDERIYGASILDITPTLLAHLRLPVGRDMVGRVLEQVFETPPAVERVGSWDDLPGNAGEHPADLRVDPVAAAESIRQLVELGYLAPVGEDKQKLIDLVKRERQFNLAMMLLEAHQPDRAADVLEALLRDEPDHPRYTMMLASAYLAVARVPDALRLLDAQHQAGKLDPIGQTIFAQQLANAGDQARAAQIIEPLASLPDAPPRLRQAIALVLRSLGRSEDALPHLQAALAGDETLVESWYTLAAIAHESGRHAEAIDLARRATALVYAFPAGHHLISLCLLATGDLVGARRACETAVQIDPGNRPARRTLAELCVKLGDLAAASEHRRYIA